MNKDNKLKLSKDAKDDIIHKIRTYIDENFEIDIGNLQAEIFLDYITENIGSYYYNIGVENSMAFISEKTDELYLIMLDEN